jgi:predicted secreted Zn-dependent protease
MFFKRVLPAILLFCSMQTSAQRIIIGGEETSRSLKWSDFTGSPDYGVEYFGFTYWNISYSYDAFQYKGDTANWQVQITLELGKNSWKKKDKITDTLLKHEQGHFDIGILCAMELQQRVNTTIFFKNDYQAKLAVLIKEVVDKYKKMDLQYDEETKHHANREQQWKWDAFFNEKIKRN